MWFHTMADGLNFHRLGNLLLGCCQHRLTTDFGLEQCVHQSRLSQAALSCKQKHTDYTDRLHSRGIRWSINQKLGHMKDVR